jgi:hypothetical protein
VLCACARVCVCWYYFTNLCTVSVCLPVHTVTQTHRHTHTSNTKNTGKYMPSNDRTQIGMFRSIRMDHTNCLQVAIKTLHWKINTFTQAHYLSTQPRETHTLTAMMKARQKRPLAGSTTGSRTNEAPCIDEKQRVRQPAVRSRVCE